MATKTEEELDRELEERFQQNLDQGRQQAHEEEGESPDPDEITIGDPVEGEPPDRAARRAARPALMDELNQSRAELERLRSENATMNQRLQALEQRPVQHQAPPPAVDELAQREQEISGEQNSILAAWQSDKLTAEQRTAMRERLAALNKESIRIEARREYDRNQQARPVQSPEEQRAAAVRANLEADFADVYADQRAVAWTDGRYRTLLAEGNHNPVQAARRALAEARDRFKTSPNAGPKPTEADRRRHRGESRGVPSGNNKSTYRLKPGDRDIALAHFSHLRTLTDEQKVQKWVNEVMS